MRQRTLDEVGNEFLRSWVERHIDPDMVLDCDCCQRPMNFSEYKTHRCPALHGLNPWTEKMKRSKWKIPKHLKGTLRARGICIKEPGVKRERIDTFLLAVVIIAAIIATAWVASL